MLITLVLRVPLTFVHVSFSYRNKNTQSLLNKHRDCISFLFNFIFYALIRHILPLRHNIQKFPDL